MNKELFIGGYDLSAYITENKQFISPDEFEIYELIPFLICVNVPYDLMLMFRYPRVKMGFWFNGNWGHTNEIQYLGRGLRLWITIKTQITYEGLPVSRKENVVLLGIGYGDENE